MTQGANTSGLGASDRVLPAAAPEALSNRNGGRSVFGHLGPRQRYLWMYLLAISVGAGVLAVALRRQAAGVAAMWLMAAVTAWFVARLSSQALRRRLRRLREAADAIGRGELDHRIDLRGHDDFVKLAEALDRMAARLEAHLAERDGLQKELARAEKLACLGELAATVAHEVNNPLDGLQNAVRIIGRSHGDHAQTRHLLDLMAAGLERIELLVRRLMGLARSGPPQFEPVRVDEVVEEALLFVQPRLNRNGIKVVREFPAEPPCVSADRRQLAQALTNLLLNAADAMPAGGQVALAALNGPDGGPVSLEVRDTGTGIGESHLPRIFEPFYTTKRAGEGNGLGLAVVARIVEAHRGRIQVESRAGRGTTFRMELPRAQPAGGAGPDDSPPSREVHKECGYASIPKPGDHLAPSTSASR